MEDKIIDKIKKLIRLQESAQNIGSNSEAENAALAIRRLLLEHNLSMESVTSSLEKDENNIIENNLPYIDKEICGGVWPRELMAVISSNNFCSLLYRRNKGEMMIIGRSSNVEVVMYLFYFVKDKFKEMAIASWNSSLEKELNKNRYTYMRHYINGAIRGLNVKLQNERKVDMKNENIHALILTREKEIQDFVKKKHNPRNRKLREPEFNDVMVKGFHEGKNIQINQGLNGKIEEQKRLT